MNQSVNGIFSNNSALPPPQRATVDDPAQHELPPDSSDVQDPDHPLDWDQPGQPEGIPQQQPPIVEDEVTEYRNQPPVWERMRNQLGHQLKIRIPAPQRTSKHHEDLEEREEVIRSWMHEFSNMANTIESMRQEITDFKANAENLIKKSAFGTDLDDHGMIIPKCLPNSGSGYPSLCDPAKLKLIDFHFPPRGRWSGGRNCMPVRAFLDTMTRAQTICCLRFNEFCHIMLTRCTPPALDVIQTAIANKDDIKTIYVAFINAFDREKEPNTWQTMLFNYLIPRNHNMEKVVAEVGKLATKASFQFESPESRRMYADQTGLEVLKQVLPWNAVRHVEDTIATLRLQKSRLPTYNEVASGLKHKARTLDAELMAAPASYKFGPPRDFMMFDKTRPTTESRPVKQRTYVKAILHNSTDDSTKPNDMMNGQGNHRSRRDSQTSNQLRSRSYSKGNQREDSQHNMTKQRNVMTRGKKYCVLCTGNNHDAADGCYSIKNDVGKPAIVGPAYGHCEPCFKKMNKKMFHPEAFCPLREALLKLYREKKLRPYGIFAEYIKSHPELNIEIRPPYNANRVSNRPSTPHNR